MAHLNGPSFITLPVRDLEKSRHFYADVLGFNPSPEVRPNALAFATEPIPFAIRKTSEDLDKYSHMSGAIILWFKADDSAAVCEKLKKAEVPIVQDIAQGPFGKTFTFRDPDGYLISVYDGG